MKQIEFVERFERDATITYRHLKKNTKYPKFQLRGRRIDFKIYGERNKLE